MANSGKTGACSGGAFCYVFGGTNAVPTQSYDVKFKGLQAGAA